MTILFWVLLLLLLYAFIGYPLLLWVLGLTHSRRGEQTAEHLPSVSVVLSVFNEEAVITEKVVNFLALNYPPERLELIVLSDGSTDRTEEILRNLESDRVRLIAGKKRRGKTRNLNLGVRLARGEIVLFTDANSMLDSDAVRNLVRPFGNPQVGLVSGRSIYLDPANQEETVGGAYRRYEEGLKKLESRAGSIVGADGAIYAMRRELYRPLPPEYINDFVHTIETVLQGRTAISEPSAVCMETVEDRKDEMRRQIRMMTQSWRIYFSTIGRLLSRRCWRYAWALTSHKALRWLTLPLLVLLLAATLIQAQMGGFYLFLLAFELLFAGLAIAGRFQQGRWARLAHGFVLVHYAALVGLVKYLSGAETFVTWNPRNS